MTSLAALRRSPIALLVVLLLGLTFTGTAYAALQPSAPTGAAGLAASTTAEDVEEGRKLFLANCATCHGTNAEGVETVGPSLHGVGEAAVHFQVETGRMPMPDPDVQAKRNEDQRKLNDRQVEQLAAYIGSLAPGPGLPDPQYLDLEGADIAAGAATYRTNCAMCHSASGSGGALTRGKFAPTLMNVDEDHIYQAMVTGPQAMPVFNDQNITPQEKENVIAFLKFVENGGNEHGGAGLGNVGPAGDALFIWTIGIGTMIALAVWIGRKAA